MASIQETADSPENAAKMSADNIERALDSGPFATWAQPLAALAVAVAEACTVYTLQTLYNQS